MTAPKTNQMLLPDPFCDLSLEERGVLATMINRPDADYVTAEKLTTFSRDGIQTVQAALDGLVAKGYLLQDGQIYIVNKLRLPDMVRIPTGTGRKIVIKEEDLEDAET